MRISVITRLFNWDIHYGVIDDPIVLLRHSVISTFVITRFHCAVFWGLPALTRASEGHSLGLNEFLRWKERKLISFWKFIVAYHHQNCLLLSFLCLRPFENGMEWMDGWLVGRERRPSRGEEQEGFYLIGYDKQNVPLNGKVESSSYSVHSWHLPTFLIATYLKNNGP